MRDYCAGCEGQDEAQTRRETPARHPMVLESADAPTVKPEPERQYAKCACGAGCDSGCGLGCCGKG